MGRDLNFSGRQPKAAQKSLAVLEAVAQLGPGATARQIGDALGAPAPTVYRLLQILVSDGYLVRMPDLRGFALGRRTADLASAAGGEPSLDAIHDAVAQVRERTRFGVYGAAFSGGELSFIDMDPHHELADAPALISHPHASAVGKLLLAYRRDALAGCAFTTVTKRTITSSEALRLDEIAASGLARERDEAKLGRSAIAVAVRSAAGMVLGGVTVIGQSGAFEPVASEMAELLTGIVGVPA
jgi:DNA-binding IclR family transcriptional regulator